MKKLFDKILFIFFVFVFTLLNTICAFSNSYNDITKIISIAYDDSGSMKNNGQDFAYASYGLQNIIGVMNENDKLNVVKMSDVYKSNNFHIDNYELRKNEIEDVRNYLPIAENSNFQTVKTAVNYLVDQKIKNGNNPNIEYYLVVLTDGKFDNYDNQISKYISEMDYKFRDVFYRGIYIGIGDKVSNDLREDVLKAPNNYYLTTKNNEGIVNALYEAHDIIYNRQLIDNLVFDEKNATVSFDAKDNVKKIIIFEQGQQVPVVDILSDNVKANEKLVFTGIKSITPTLNSYIVHASNTYAYLPKGKINIEFLDKVDMNKNKLRVMVEYENYNGKSRQGSGKGGGLGDSDQNSGGDKDKQGGENGDGDVGGLPYETTGGNDTRISSVSDKRRDNPDVIIEKSSNIVEEEPYVEENIITTLEDDIEPIHTLETTYETTTSIYEGPTQYVDIGLAGCGLGSCGCALNRCYGPHTLNSPISPPYKPNLNSPINWIFGGLLPFVFSFLPIFLMLALLYGYFTKPRFDTKYHDILVKRGRQVIDEGSMIRTNFMSKLFPFYAERGYGDNLFIKAHKDKDKVIIPKRYLTSDMKIDGDEINVNRDFTWYEDSELTKIIDGEKLTYIYRSRPYTERNTK